MISTLLAADLYIMQDLINGAIFGGRKAVGTTGKVLGLHGKTLVFNDPLIPANPLGTVTFDNPGGAGLTPEEINDQIHDVGNPGPFPLAIYMVTFADRTARLIEITPTNGILLKGTSTASPVFGFGKEDVATVIYNPFDGVAPRVIGVQPTVEMDSYYATVELP